MFLNYNTAKIGWEELDDNFKKSIPDGVQDYAPIECKNKRSVEESLRKNFELWGYNEVQTPAFEYYDVFAHGIGSYRQEKLIKFIDSDGRILALRPDLTLPIARFVTSTPENLTFPLRFFYIDDAFGYDNPSARYQRQFTQAGIELIGDSSPYADAEVIAMAIESLYTAGLEHFTIDIGQVDYFKGLIEEAKLSQEQGEALRRGIDTKNMIEVDNILLEAKVNAEMKSKILELPFLYGGEEVLDKARKFAANDRSKKAVENVGKIYKALCSYGYERHLSIDFSMLQEIDYYTGMIFKGYVMELGAPILGGGRYDSLLAEFGHSLPSTGFAVSMKGLLIAMEKQNGLKEDVDVDVAIGNDEESAKIAFALLKKYRDEGRRAVSTMDMDRDETLEYAQKIGAKEVYYVKNNVTEKIRG